MSILDAIILAIVEGITEFLPVSSTGHLILTSNALGIYPTDFVKSFEIIIQLGAILAVLVLYWRTLIKGTEVWKKIFIAFIPTAVIGLTLYKFIKSFLLGNPLITVLALLIGGIILILIENFYKPKIDQVENVEKISYKNAFLIGLCQSVSIIPGVSRAGATIIGGMLTGAKRSTAVEFSFFLALPTMFAATALDIRQSSLAFSQNEIFLILTGLLTSFLVALLVIKFFIKYVQTNSFIPFGIYRILLAILYYFIFLN